MKASATFSFSDNAVKIVFDVFEAVWSYFLHDNVGILTNKKANSLSLFSFATGKELATVSLTAIEIERLASCENIELNFLQGGENSAILKNEAIDISGKFEEAIEAQFAGKNQSAVAFYKAAVEANPKNFRAYNLLGRCQRAEGELDKAYQSYAKAIDIAPWSPEPYCNMGVLYQKKNNEEQAQSYFGRTIEIDNFYLNALLKRASWLLKNKPEDYELKLLNLRLSSVYNDVTSAQNHIKTYMEKMGYDRVAYADKETALFGEFAEPDIQNKLKIIEGCVINGAFGAAVKNMQGILDFSKEKEIERRVAGWCHLRANRIFRRLPENISDSIRQSVKSIIDSTPTPEDLRAEAEKAAKIEAMEAVKNLDREKMEEARKAAIEALENKIDANGDYAQPIGYVAEKALSGEEKAESLAERDLVGEAIESSMPAPVAEKLMPNMPNDEGPAKVAVSMPDVPNDEGPAKVAVSMPDVPNDEGPAKVAVSMPDVPKEEGPAKVAVSMPNVPNDEGPAPVIENAVNLEEGYRPPVKGVKPATVQEFFMLVIFEIMRDGEIEETERRFLANLKASLKISDEDFTKMFNNVRSQVKSKGLEQGKKGKFDMKRVFKNLCKAVMRDGVLDNSEKKLLFYACKIFKISDKEARQILSEARANENS